MSQSIKPIDLLLPEDNLFSIVSQGHVQLLAWNLTVGTRRMYLRNPR